MNLKRYIKPLAVFYFVLAYAVLCAQGWEKTYGGTLNDVANDLIQTSDNGWLMVGSSASFGGSDRDVYLIKTDVDGTEQWHRSFGTAMIEDVGNAAALQADGSIIIAGASGNTEAKKGMIWKRDALGNSIWSYETPEDSITLRDIAISSDNSIVAVGSEGDRIFIIKLNENGSLVWDSTLVANDIENGLALEMLSDNSFVIAGYTHSNASSIDAYLAKFDTNGTLVWQKPFGKENKDELAQCITTSQNGGFFLAGFSEGETIDDEIIWLSEVDSNGDSIYSTTITIEKSERARAITQLPDGNLLIAGDIDTFLNDFNGFLLKYDTSNDSLHWTRSFGGLSRDYLYNILHFDNHIYLSGTTQSFGAGNFDSWLIKADNEGRSLTNVLEGNVFEDANLDCLFDSNETGIENWLIEIRGNRLFYTNPNSDGYYNVNVEEGNYEVRLHIPNPYWQPCENDVLISFSGADSVEVNFALQPTTSCPYLTVDLSTPFLRRCFPNAYTVNYCNSGTQTASNATLTVEFDSFLNIDSSEVNLTPLGNNQFEFQIGDLAPFECGSFRIYTTVDCNSTVLGQTHCNIARITPDTFCLQPDPNWDGSSLEVSAFCDGDSVRINVTNTAPTAMTAASSFIIIEDEILTRVGPVILGGNGDTTFVLDVNGETIRFEVDQPPGHPGNSMPSIAIEGCGANPFSLGFITQFPQDDGDNFVEIDCQENIGAYDPNDKRGFPKGYGTEKLIENDTEIEYIIRFQNTGTDTAFTVVIRDTLKQELDPESLKLGTSSHPYEFEIYDNGVLKFTFNDILLVDSFTNEPASHGFVKFKIKPDFPLHDGTPILNSADIYFDFNPPITTNQSLHRIGSNFIKVDTTSSVYNAFFPNVSIEIAPNPFTDQTQITLKGIDPDEYQFQLYNAFGKMVDQQKFTGSQFYFKRHLLPKGVYFFSIKTEQHQWIASGKIVLQ